MKCNTSQSLLPFEQGQAFVNITTASSTLGVSSATVRNWIKGGYVRTHKGKGKLLFDANHIQEIKRQLASGESRRLQKRANKKSSKGSFIPEEYISAQAELSAVEKLIKQHKQDGHSLHAFIFAVILELTRNYSSKPSIKKELEWWRGKTKGALPRVTLDITSNQCDFLGLLYQSLLAEGLKSETGAYYTPPHIAREMILEHTRPDSRFLDPCCGTGLFLLQASEVITNPEHIVGYDMDETAVHIARINLLLRFPKIEFEPQIYCRCGLLNPMPHFDVVATNPPWGAHFGNDVLLDLQKLYDTDSNESFSFFIQAGIHNLKNNGFLSILLPESFLNIRTHQQIRRTIAEHTCIQKVCDLGRIFKKVFTPVVRLDVKKTKPASSHKFVVLSSGAERLMPQNRLITNNHCIFDISNNDLDCSILDGLYSTAHQTLQGQAQWALGIVTGDNARFISDVERDEMEPILTGKEIRHFRASKPTRFIHFEPNQFQQVAPVGFYRAPEKLLYKFISKELVFAYDDKQILVLNSANILIPQLKGYSIKTALAFLNSKVFQFIFQRKFGALKVLRGNLESLPFPNISKSTDGALSILIDMVLDPNTNEKDKCACRVELDKKTMNAFGLDRASTAHILRTVQ